MSRANHFDFLRMLSALLVLISHHVAVLGLPEPMFFGLATWGTMAVFCFFTMSGFLVSQSWVSDPHFGRFLARRAWRILPGFALVLLLSVLVFGALFSGLSLEKYYLNSKTWAYLQAILLLNYQETLPEIFVQNPYAGVMNVSLWTIRWEVWCYVALALLGMVGALRSRKVLAALMAAILALFLLWNPDAHLPQLPVPQASALAAVMAFVCGVLGFAIWDVVRAKFWVFAVFWLLLVANLAMLSRFYALVFVVLPVLILSFAQASFPVLRRAGRFGDPSFGVYLLAFPISQMVVALFPNLNLAASLALSLSLTLTAAFALWHGVEKHALAQKPKKPVQH